MQHSPFGKQSGHSVNPAQSDLTAPKDNTAFSAPMVGRDRGTVRLLANRPQLRSTGNQTPTTCLSILNIDVVGSSTGYSLPFGTCTLCRTDRNPQVTETRSPTSRGCQISNSLWCYIAWPVAGFWCRVPYSLAPQRRLPRATHTCISGLLSFLLVNKRKHRFLPCLRKINFTTAMPSPSGCV